LWFCCKVDDDNNVITLFYGGGAMEKAMVRGGFFPSFFCGSFGLVH
jgi:hypothetical protein